MQEETSSKVSSPPTQCNTYTVTLLWCVCLSGLPLWSCHLIDESPLRVSSHGMHPKCQPYASVSSGQVEARNCPLEPFQLSPGSSSCRAFFFAGTTDKFWDAHSMHLNEPFILSHLTLSAPPPSSHSRPRTLEALVGLSLPFLSFLAAFFMALYSLSPVLACHPLLLKYPPSPLKNVGRTNWHFDSPFTKCVCERGRTEWCCSRPKKAP